MSHSKLAWLVIPLLTFSIGAAAAETKEVRGVVTWVGRHSIHFMCGKGSSCEGQKLKLDLDDRTDMGPFSLASIHRREVRIAYEIGDGEANGKLLSIREMILPEVVEAEGMVTSASRAQVTFACGAASACAGQTLTLKVTGDTDLNGYSVFYLPGKTARLRYDKQGGLVKIVGTQADDPRDSFKAGVFTGLAIDTFAAGDLNRYLNPEESGDLRERAVAGFHFDYRLFGEPSSVQQLWVFGETVHGARSTDIDCRETPDVPGCSDSFDATNPDVALFLIRNATSLEGFLGLRYEFAPLQKMSPSPARGYVKARAGFVAVSGDGKDVADVSSLAAGAMVIAGRCAGSFLEVGYGTSALFVEKPNGRYRLDALLTWHPRWLEPVGVSPFAELTADVDLEAGPDSIQTYIGFDFDVERLFGPKLPDRKGKAREAGAGEDKPDEDTQ